MCIRDRGDSIKIDMPESFEINDNLIIEPASAEDAANVEVLRGPNIKEFPLADALPENISAKDVYKRQVQYF